MSLELKDMEVDADKVFYKAPTIPREVEKYEEPVDLDQLLEKTILAMRACEDEVGRQMEAYNA